MLSQRTTDADWKIITKEPQGTSQRTIDLGAAATNALREHRARMEVSRGEWGSAYTDSGLVFVQDNGVGYLQRV